MLAAITLALLLCPRCASSAAGEAVASSVHQHNSLAESSAAFLSTHSCDGIAERIQGDIDGDESFSRWVLSARHTASPGWEVELPHHHFNQSSSSDAAEDDGGGAMRYARVFDMLNWSRERRLLPVPVDVTSICHKGMGMQTEGSDDCNIPAKPNVHIPTDTWTSLWSSCSKQLLSTRSSSSCIDVPGVVVRNPDPPLKPNNPCSLEYRLVDGAHRMCLRKYLLALLKGEAIELETQLKGGLHSTPISNGESIKREIERKQALIDQSARGMYLVLNQTTFESMLMNSRPQESWARSKEHLMKGITQELRLDWKGWMGDVMDEVSKSKIQRCGDACTNYLRTPVVPKEEL